MSGIPIIERDAPQLRWLERAAKRIASRPGAIATQIVAPASLGVALLVMLPVLYTDVGDSWRLPSRRQRLAIGVAGVAAELGLALLATFLWSFLPDGPLRSAAFLVATTTWVSTLAINLSPFMRFDGDYLLSDWLGVSNLQERSFALARWQMRRWLFALDEPEPETFSPSTRRILLVYAWTTWAYRAVVYRVTLAPAAPMPSPEQVTPGIALVEADAVSPLRRIWRATIGVLIRESGF